MLVGGCYPARSPGILPHRKRCRGGSLPGPRRKVADPFVSRCEPSCTVLLSQCETKPTWRHCPFIPHRTGRRLPSERSSAQVMFRYCLQSRNLRGAVSYPAVWAWNAFPGRVSSPTGTAVRDWTRGPGVQVTARFCRATVPPARGDCGPPVPAAVPAAPEATHRSRGPPDGPTRGPGA